MNPGKLREVAAQQQSANLALQLQQVGHSTSIFQSNSACADAMFHPEATHRREWLRFTCENTMQAQAELGVRDAAAERAFLDAQTVGLPTLTVIFAISTRNLVTDRGWLGLVLTSLPSHRNLPLGICPKSTHYYYIPTTLHEICQKSYRDARGAPHAPKTTVEHPAPRSLALTYRDFCRMSQASCRLQSTETAASSLTQTVTQQKHELHRFRQRDESLSEHTIEVSCQLLTTVPFTVRGPYRPCLPCFYPAGAAAGQRADGAQARGAQDNPSPNQRAQTSIRLCELTD